MLHDRTQKCHSNSLSRMILHSQNLFPFFFCLSVKAACAVMWCNVSYFILSLLIASKTLYWPIVIYLHLIPIYFWKPPWVYQKFINCNQSVYVSTILSSDLPITWQCAKQKKLLYCYNCYHFCVITQFN